LHINHYNNEIYWITSAQGQLYSIHKEYMIVVRRPNTNPNCQIHLQVESMIIRLVMAGSRTTFGNDVLIVAENTSLNSTTPSNISGTERLLTGLSPAANGAMGLPMKSAGPERQ
jgi:hypothetical protein